MIRRRTVLFLCVVVVSGFMLSGVHYAFYDMDRLGSAQDRLMVQSFSPDGNYRVDVYQHTGGSSVNYATLAKLVDIRTAKSKNIYWGARELDRPSVEWKDHDTVVINGRQLDVPDETYDFRRAVSSK